MRNDNGRHPLERTGKSISEGYPDEVNFTTLGGREREAAARLAMEQRQVADADGAGQYLPLPPGGRCGAVGVLHELLHTTTRVRRRLSFTIPWAGRPHEQRVDASLSALLVMQSLTLFVVISLSAVHPAGLMLFDACHVGFAVVCVALLTRHSAAQGALLAGPTLLVVAQLADGRLSGCCSVGTAALTELIAFSAFAFNGLVTGLVARHVFGPGRVTAHRAWDETS